ncbi:biotin transporter BioY [Kurthia massiliensis]|uniref:biotin transporter BioY n=1 Tax=Kurthia massiliensis TaxID=1033739 RepID=UPI0002893C4F|nr:biotin transporter BioY [Kurthia massiliensis]
MQHHQLKMSIVAALFAAIIAIFAQLTIPLPLVPITGQTLAVGLAITILGLQYGTIAVTLYIALGAIGLPVFSGMSGGFGVIIGPTGGYIIGFFVQALGMGLYLERFGYTKTHALVANLIGMIITLIIGALWLKLFMHLSWMQAFVTGVVAFVPVGILKAVIAGWFGSILRERLIKARLLIVKSSY